MRTWLLAAALAWAPAVHADEPVVAASAGCPPPPSAFGTKDKLPVGIEGKIYFLDPTTYAIPDFTDMKPVGSIYTSKWDVPLRAFKDGFPGVTDRFDWFAIDYRGPIWVAKAGTYAFRLASDDGSMLYIDGKEVIDLDGLHNWYAREAKVELTAGEHELRLSYMQGPAVELGLQLFVTPPGEAEKLFNLQDFSKAVQDSRQQLAVTENAKEILVKLASEVLFDTDKYVLKPAATASLEKLATLLRGYPGMPIVVEGHTDSDASDAYNQVLSEHRAQAVGEWLVTQGKLPRGCLTMRGLGESRPVATNKTPAGKQKNRRVEIKLEK